MILEDFHVHTCYCDGKDTPRDIAAQAYKMGIKKLGFSGHSFVPFDLPCCMLPENEAKYFAEVQALKEEYKGKMEIFCGTEQDFYSEQPNYNYDYKIGSVHYIKVADDTYFFTDLSPKSFVEGIRDYFDGDVYNLCETYYDMVARILDKTDADIIGHLDLITKFNESTPLIDVNHPRYIAAWQRAVDALLPHGKPFEINTGAISRGYRTTPYPDLQIVKYIKAHGGKLMVNSDSHAKETLCFAFEQAQEWLDL